MWFTRVSLKNPVFATMVMLALVVLGAFSYQRLQVDQFPNIDFPVVVVTTEYPGASPEIVESEVTKKVEEAVNAIAGISALTSRSYEGQSVVIIEFNLEVNGRKAADDVREKVAAVKADFRTEVKEPKVSRFDPSSSAIWSLAVLPAPTLATTCAALDTLAPEALALPPVPMCAGTSGAAGLSPEGAVPCLGRPGAAAILQRRPRLGASSVPRQVLAPHQHGYSALSLGVWRPSMIRP